MSKEQWDFVGKVFLPKTEIIMANRDEYGVWINPFTKERQEIMIRDNSEFRK